MATVKLIQDGYGQVELNQVAFRRDGRIEAQCKLDESQFSKTTPCENGMLLAVDNVSRTIHLPTASVAASGDDPAVPGYDRFPIALHYSTEHIYDERTPGLKNFRLYPENHPFTGFESYVYPRLGYLAVGDKFTTNSVIFDSADWANVAALTAVNFATTEVFGGISDDGYIQLTDDKSEITAGPILQVRFATTMPDGQPALAFICIKD